MAKGIYQEWLTPERLTLLRGWAREGLTDEQVAKKIGIRTGTLYAWKNKYTELDDALKKGKEIVDDEAEQSLIKSYMGYMTTETTVVERMNEVTGKLEVVERRTVEKEVPPNVTAIIFWLKNRRPLSWRENNQLNTEDKRVVIINDIPSETE